MADLDAFELRFTAAYRRYLDEAQTEVDAAAIARSVAGGASRRRAGARGWPHRAVPAGAWAVVLVALLAAALVGAYLIGQRLPELPVTPVATLPASPGPSANPGPSGPVGLIGTWSSAGENPATLVLQPCSLGERCGRFERFWDNEHCVYTLDYRPPEGEALVFWLHDANTFMCAYDLLPTDLHVVSVGGDKLLAATEPSVRPGNSWELLRTSALPEPQVPSQLVGEWVSVGANLAPEGGREILHLDPCGPGEWCGSLTVVVADRSVCGYVLQYRPKKSYDEFLFWIAAANGAQCVATGWSQTPLVVRPVAVGEVLVTHSPGVEFTLYEPGFEPGPSAGPPAGG